MGRKRGNPGRSSRETGSIADDDFVTRFEAGYRLFWTIAAGVTGDRTAADDIVYEAALQGLVRREQFQSGTDFNAWMSQIVRFVSLNHLRTERKHRGVSRPDGHGDPLAAIADQRLRDEPPLDDEDVCGHLSETQPHFDDQVLAALNQLSDTARVCLLLRTVNDLSYMEIAELLDIPQGTAMSHVHRSRQSMRQQLAKYHAKDPVGKGHES